MRYDTPEYISGCRNSILTAIRRGDHELAKSTFEVIWYSDRQRVWLKWRLPLMVVSEAYHLIGEYAMFVDRQKTSRIPEEKAYKTFIHVLVAADKSKDVDALFRLSDLDSVKEENKFREVHVVRQMLTNYSFDPVTVLATLREQLSNLTEYEQFAGKFLIDKIIEGGLLAGIRLMLVCVMMICIRGLPQQAVRDHLGEIITKKNLAAKIKMDVNCFRDFPWYVFDSRTSIGIQAAKNIKSNIMEMCSHFEIDFIPEQSLNKRNTTDTQPTCFDNVWWPYYQKKRVKFSQAKWSQVQPQIKREIDNLLSKL